MRTEVSPAQLGFVGAAQIGRLDRWRTENNQEQAKHTQLWLVTSREIDRLPPAEFLAARRAEWGIENGLHYVLDVGANEDLHLRVRDRNALHVLTLLNRLSVCLWRRTRPNPDQSYRTWSETNRAKPSLLLRLIKDSPAKFRW